MGRTWQDYGLLAERFRTDNYKPPAAFVAALTALLPEHALHVDDSLDVEVDLTRVVSRDSPKGGGSRWSALCLSGDSLIYVRASSADDYWTWDDHRRIDELDGAHLEAAWVRPISHIRSLAVERVRVDNHGPAGTFTSLHYSVRLDGDGSSVSLVDPPAEFISAIKDAWFKSRA